MRINSVIITFNNGFEKIVDRDSVRNFNSLLDWLDMFNNGDDVGMLTMTGRDLGSNFTIDSSNVKSIEVL